MKTYKLICSDFGWKFSFTATNESEANYKKIGWCNYHSFDSSKFSIEETTDTNRIHNEYM